MTNYSRETADRFESAARQPGQDFTDVYSSIVAMQQSSRDMRSYMAQITTTNMLLQQRGLSDFDGDGSGDCIIGAKNGLIYTADPKHQLIQARDRNFRVVAEQQVNLPPLSVSEQGRDNCFGDRRHHSRRRDCYRDRREEQPPAQLNEQPPQQVEQLPQQVEQPAQQVEQPAKLDEQPSAPRAEQWGSREFHVKGDGSAEYSIKSGDTVWDISTDVLRGQLGREPSGAEIVDQVQRIASASGLADANLIYPGDKLSIPAAGDTSVRRQDSTIDPAYPYSNGDQGNSDGDWSSEEDSSTDQVTPEANDLPPARQDGLPRHSNGNRSSWYISQVGDDQLRSDGWFGCGPTSLLMGLADWGTMEPSEANRRQLLQETGTLAAGQFPGDARLISTWAKNKGLQSEYSLTKPDIEGMDRAIAEGKTLVVNGSMLGRDGKTAYPHFVYIAGKDANGNYILGDPAQSNVATWTRDQLYAFVTRGSNPPGYATLWR